MHNRPFTLFQGTEREIILEDKCPICKGTAEGQTTTICDYCRGQKWVPSFEGETILQFIHANLWHLFPNIETLAVFLDKFYARRH